MGFVHLHVHSYYSFLDGVSSLDRLLGRASALGMSALALTDHNRLSGAIRFYRKARNVGIKPIIGAEINMESVYHLTLLCKDMGGYSNLCHLITDAHLSNQYRCPIVTKEMLGRYNGGLIALSGCSKGELLSLMLRGEIEKGETTCFTY